MKKIVRIPSEVMTSIVERGARVEEKKEGVMLIRLKSGIQDPMDIMAEVMADLAEANPGLIITASGITPVPNRGGVVFNGIVSFAPVEKFLVKV